MRKKLWIISLLSLLIALTAGETLAYFTAEQQARNVITTGTVDIAIEEWADTARTIPFTGSSNVLPGTSVTKIPEIRNQGTGEVWVRVKVITELGLAEGGQPESCPVELDINRNLWIAGADGYYYYILPLASGEVTEPVFTTVTFPADMGNDYQNSTVSVRILAQSVQTAHNGTTCLEAVGWPAEGTP